MVRSFRVSDNFFNPYSTDLNGFRIVNEAENVVLEPLFRERVAINIKFKKEVSAYNVHLEEGYYAIKERAVVLFVSEKVDRFFFHALFSFIKESCVFRHKS